MSHRAAHGLAVVTGASSGIGAAIALHLARRGQPVLAVARRAERLDKLAASAGTLDAPIHPLALDVGEAGAAERVLEESRRLGGATWLVNDAGFGMYGPFASQPPERLVAMMRLNCEALVLLTHAFVGDLVRAERAVILNVASMAGFQPTPFMSVYGATKAFVLTFSEAIREELRRTRVTVTVFCPGPVDTEFGDVAGLAARLATPPGRISADEAARSALAAADRGRAIEVPGRLGQATAIAVQLLPRAVVRRASHQILSPRHEEDAPGPPWAR